MKRISIRRIASGLASLILYSAVGAAGGLASWYLAARAVDLWRYDPLWVSTGFLIVLMAAGYVVPEVVERLLGFLNPGSFQVSTGGWAKSFRVLVSAILVPVAVFVAANRVSWLSAQLVPPPSDEYRLVSQVADTVMASGSSATRVAGIEALGAVSSKDSLAMLTKIVEQQPSILDDRSAYTALTKAIAGYGPQAKSWLLNFYHSHSQPVGAGGDAGVESDVYDRYFQPPFSDLQAEVKRAVADPARQNELLLRLAAAESRLKSDLADMEARQAILESGDRTMDFVLDTLAGFKPSEDPDISQLAKQVAGDAAYGVGTRRRAILLVGQFGAPKDYAALLPYLQDSDESLRATALVAVKSLYQKPGTATAGSSSK